MPFGSFAIVMATIRATEPPQEKKHPLIEYAETVDRKISNLESEISSMERKIDSARRRSIYGL